MTFLTYSITCTTHNGHFLLHSLTNIFPKYKNNYYIINKGGSMLCFPLSWLSKTGLTMKVKWSFQLRFYKKRLSRCHVFFAIACLTSPLELLFLSAPLPPPPPPPRSLTVKPCVESIPANWATSSLYTVWTVHWNIAWICAVYLLRY